MTPSWKQVVLWQWPNTGLLICWGSYSNQAWDILSTKGCSQWSYTISIFIVVHQRSHSCLPQPHSLFRIIKRLHFSLVFVSGLGNTFEENCPKSLWTNISPFYIATLPGIHGIKSKIARTFSSQASFIIKVPYSPKFTHLSSVSVSS